MRYYVAWTHSDPIYQSDIPGISVLVSPPNVSLTWRARDWPAQPESLIVDSGAYQYRRQGRSPTPEWVLERQLQMAEGLDIPVGLCHLDVPVLGTRSLTELDRRIEQNFERARWLIDRTREHPLPPNMRPIGVIQGYSVETVYAAAQVLSDMGYASLALGSLVGLVSSSRDELYRRVEAAIEAAGPALHVLGVSSASVLARLVSLGVESADSGAPAHEAWRGGVYYSDPFRRFKVPSPHFREWSRSYTFAEILTEPLACDCPVCRKDAARLLQPRGKEYVRLRATHNCHHLDRELRIVRSSHLATRALGDAGPPAA
jgi:7-cyano-7-deazaguanine tRNA-ribosyltransferase